MSAQQHVHNIFAEEETNDQHDEADVNNAYRTYAMHVADAVAAAVTTNTTIDNNPTTHEVGDIILPPPPRPPVTNLYNAAHTVGGSVMPHAQMLLQAAAGGRHLQHTLQTTTTTAGSMSYSSVAQPNNNDQLPRQPMNIFDAAEDAYAQHIADLHAANQYSTVDEQSAAAAANNNDTSNAAAVGGSIIRPTLPLPHIHPKNIGMPETVIPPKWLARYNELKRYKQQHGDCCVPQDNKQLSSWVRTQKQQYKLMKDGKHCHMSQPRLDLLDEIEFEWSGVKRDQFWKDRYNDLVQFHSKNGHTRVPEKYLVAPQLYAWMNSQRRQLKLKKEGKKNKLTDERMKLLEAMGVEYQIRSTVTWMERFAQLKEYKERHGDCNVPQKHPDNPCLGRWVDNQKTQHKKLYDGKTTHLTIERIQLLVSIGFDFRLAKKDK